MLMIDDNVGCWIVHNGIFQSCSPEDQLEFAFQGPIIYEVIRYINRKGLFKDDHLVRLEHSAEGQGIQLPLTRDTYDCDVEALLTKTSQRNCNIKLLVCEGQYIIYLSRTFYPGEEVYQVGVDTASIEIERPDPNAKVRRDSYIETIGQFRREHGVFEALLVSKEGCYTEGSRSNLFFVKRNDACVYTAPSAMILEGVMRRHLLKVCETIGVPVVQKAVTKEDLPQIEAAFLTGTSIKVLPIAKIDGVMYNSSTHPLVQKLMKSFDEYIGV